MDEQIYTNWFANDGQKNFYMHLLRSFAGKPIRCLQIGAYTGDASVWIYDNLLKNSMNWSTVESLYDSKTKEGQDLKKIFKYKGTSDSFFKNNRQMYDFIYVDGDHTAYGVLKDAVASYECLNVGGIIAFDDYQWSAGLGPLKEPKMAIDAFGSIYRDRLELVLQDYQCWYRKIG